MLNYYNLTCPIPFATPYNLYNVAKCNLDKVNLKPTMPAVFPIHAHDLEFIPGIRKGFHV